MMNLTQMKQFISWTNGRFFTVEFVKKDGSVRRMNCRTGVKRYSNGGRPTTAHIAKYVTVYDVVKRGYRTINADRILSLKCGGTEFRNKDLTKSA